MTGESSWSTWLVSALVVVSCAASAHWGHRHADAARFGEDLTAGRVSPSGPAVEVVSLGQQTLVADALWVRTVLVFADVHDAPTPSGVRWVGDMVAAVNHLDPTWRTAYFYGGTFCRVLGDLACSDRVFEQAIEALPEDPFFPFSLGMNAYLHHGDPATAASWLARASRLPSAPRWYAAAAASFVDSAGQRETALQFLEEQLAVVTDPALREQMLTQRARIEHELLQQRIAEHRQRFVERFGRDIRALSELGDLPPDPLGEGWILAPDGVVRSAAEEASIVEAAQARERNALLRPYDERFGL